MLLQTMNLHEVYHELITDYQTVNRKGAIQAPLLWRQMKRNHKKQEVCSITYKTMRRNEWNIVFRLTGEYIKTLYYLRSRDHKGPVAYNIYFQNTDAERQLYVVKYTTHFFERYNERMALGFIDTSKIIRHFFKNNFEFEQGQSNELYDGARLTNFVFEDGIATGWKDEEKKMICLKTFIANNTLTKNQQMLVDSIKNNRSYSLSINAAHLQSKF